MRSLKTALFAGAAVAAAFTSAQAADLPPIMQAPQMIAPVQVQEQMGGWYLRGDIGVGSQRFTEFDHHQTNTAFVWPASWRIDQRDMGDTTFVGGGIGFQWNSWLRFDATAEYRAKAKLKVFDWDDLWADGIWHGPAKKWRDYWPRAMVRRLENSLDGIRH